MCFPLLVPRSTRQNISHKCKRQPNTLDGRLGPRPFDIVSRIGDNGSDIVALDSDQSSRRGGGVGRLHRRIRPSNRITSPAIYNSLENLRKPQKWEPNPPCPRILFARPTDSIP